jgi:hypothetical protein
MRHRVGALIIALALMLVGTMLVSGCGEGAPGVDDATSSTVQPVTTVGVPTSETATTSDAATTSPVSTTDQTAAGAEQPTITEPPAAPADVSGMQAWFAAAYPDAAWLSRIKSIKYVAGEVPDSGGFKNAVVITTDLDFAGELALGQEIATALGEAHPAWAKQYVIWFADGRNESAGDIVDMTP